MKSGFGCFSLESGFIIGNGTRSVITRIFGRGKGTRTGRFGLISLESGFRIGKTGSGVSLIGSECI